MKLISETKFFRRPSLRVKKLCGVFMYLSVQYLLNSIAYKCGSKTNSKFLIKLILYGDRWSPQNFIW